MGFKMNIAAATLAATLLVQGAWAGNDGGETALVAQGDKQWAAGRLDDARRSFEEAVTVNPRSPDAHMKLAGLQLSGRNYAAAIQTYQRIIGLDGNNAKAWIGLGMAYLHSGQHELSRAAFGEAVRADPSRKAQLAPLLEKPAG